MHKNFHELVVDAVSVVVAKYAIILLVYFIHLCILLLLLSICKISLQCFFLDCMFCILLKDAVVSDNCDLQSSAIFRRRSINVG